jgi:hypothetical protein
MRRILPVALGGGLLGTAVYLVLGAALQLGPLPVKAAAFIACWAVGAFLVNLALDRLGP